MKSTIKIVLQDESGKVLEEAIIQEPIGSETNLHKSNHREFAIGLAKIVAMLSNGDPVRSALHFPFFVRSLIRMLKHAISEE